MIMVVDPAPVACFVAGTFIRTIHGDRTVETLREYDHLVTVSGDVVTLRRLMWRRVILTAVKEASGLFPVRILAGAFSENVPSRDLRVSGEHAMFLDGVLVPAQHLVNGGTIVREDVSEVTYYHLECERHAILLANGAPTESYLDTGNRSFFANSAGATSLKPVLPAGHPRDNLAAPWCRPEMVRTIRAHLRSRAETMGYTVVTGAAAVKSAKAPRRVA